MPKKVRVYWNLHRDCWSILHNRKVIGYADSVLLKDVNFIVSENGRQRVIKEKRKNVHAFAEGFLEKKNIAKPRNLKTKISYNPYKFGWFYKTDTEEKIKMANSVYCGNKKLFG